MNSWLKDSQQRIKINGQFWLITNDIFKIEQVLRWTPQLWLSRNRRSKCTVKNSHTGKWDRGVNRVSWRHFINPWCISLQYHVLISGLMKKTGKVWRSANGMVYVQEAAESDRAHQLKRDLTKVCKILTGMEKVTRKWQSLASSKMSTKGIRRA